MFEIRDQAGQALGSEDTLALAEARLDELTRDRPGQPRQTGTWTITDTTTGIVAAELTRYPGPPTPFRSVLATLADSAPPPEDER
ncbi:hypothetical protein DP939_36435 [Spongiactinospora rosea]|uniref:Uncharacterized protein n=1 Tax=Spongiactinospora rosea TaxID=2248750 RepID=A0A366LN56_9ACTN|nr:hypothetical protein [Spongiactinospora rosea]RBQ15331.1 hypothetical protein DP939_36435 [Spongiactinospora rosea]